MGLFGRSRDAAKSRRIPLLVVQLSSHDIFRELGDVRRSRMTWAIVSPIDYCTPCKESIM